MISRQLFASAPCGYRPPKGRRRSGFTLIEVLIASVIVGVCISAIVSTWAFAFGLSATADRESIGYSLGRRSLEELKQTGFQDSTVGTATFYYDGAGSTSSRSTTQASNHAYSVTSVVSTDGTLPATGALLTVTITVKFLGNGSTVYTCSTYLARAGI
jgi:prepilin-type N-terminal cleavage/methylation domain-containing protein